MSELDRKLSEVELIQNAALGAGLLWQFGLGYQERSLSQPAQLPFFFMVLPVCMHGETLSYLLSTRRSSGLSLFAAKLGEVRERLLAVHERALLLRELSLESIAIGVQSDLLHVEYSKAEVRSNTLSRPPIAERIKPLFEGADRFGFWCAGLGLKQASTLLQVDF